MTDYQPPFQITHGILSLVESVGEALGRLAAQGEGAQALRLRRINRIRTIQGSLAIEGNTLSEAQITAILEGKRVLAPPREIMEAQNALSAYARLDEWNPVREADLLAAHGAMMAGLLEDAGHYRAGGVGVVSGGEVIHMAPAASRVGLLMQQLFDWLVRGEAHPLIASCVFHYEFEFIHPFSDGNGRLGRLWQTLILTRWNPLFADIPVESLVHQHQADYYRALGESTARSDSAPFIEFVLRMVLEAAHLLMTPQDAPQVTPQVARLLAIMQGEMGRSEMQQRLGLADRKSFRERYLVPALESGLIAMTRPDRPNSRLQGYRLTPKGAQCVVPSGSEPS